MTRNTKIKANPLSTISEYESDIKKRFSANMKKLREDRGWNQSDLADASKIDRATISRIENNDRVPKLKNILNIAEALGVSIDDLYGYTPVNAINERFAINSYLDVIICLEKIAEKVNLINNVIEKDEAGKIPNHLMMELTDPELVRYYYTIQQLRFWRAHDKEAFPLEDADYLRNKIENSMASLAITEPAYYTDENALLNQWYTDEELEDYGESTGIQE